MSHNRPDIVVHDKTRNEMTIVEVGITSLERLQEVEIAKTRKYGPLAAELKRIYGCKVSVIPYVMTWDGVVTPYHKKCQREIGIPRNVEAYIQTVALRRTLASVVASQGRSSAGVGCSGKELSTRLARLIESGAGNCLQQAVPQ